MKSINNLVIYLFDVYKNIHIYEMQMKSIHNLVIYLYPNF